MLVCTSFSDANLHSVGSMRAFQQTGSIEPHAYAHRGPKWATFYGEEARHAQLAFFDRHLRERDVAPLPPMRLEIRDRADHVVEVRDEQEWPLARTEWRQLYLRANGTLPSGHRDGDGSVTFDLRRNAAAFEYLFDEDTELSGPMTLRLHVAVTGTDDPRLFVGVEKWSRRRPGSVQRLLRIRPRPRRPRPASTGTARTRLPNSARPTSPNTPSAPCNRFMTTSKSTSSSR